MTSWSREYKILRAQNEALKEISLAADTVKVFRIKLIDSSEMGFFEILKFIIRNQKTHSKISGIFEPNRPQFRA